MKLIMRNKSLGDNKLGDTLDENKFTKPSILCFSTDFDIFYLSREIVKNKTRYIFSLSYLNSRFVKP